MKEIVCSKCDSEDFDNVGLTVVVLPNGYAKTAIKWKCRNCGHIMKEVME